MLSDEQLLARLDTANRLERRLTVKIILLLKEVEERRLDRKEAYPSLYEFCRRRLGMSEGAANRRITAVKLVRQIPALIRHLEDGRITLSALMLIRNLITPANAETLIELVAGKSRNKIEEVVARMAPKPDVPAELTPLPAVGARGDSDAGAPLGGAPRPDAWPRLSPLSDGRWKLQLTADQELHDKIERARELMRHRNPSGDLTVLVSAAFDTLLAKLEAPRKPRPPREHRPSSPPLRRRTLNQGAVDAATRAEVFVRDGEQCTYRNARGERCPATGFLQIDHVHSRGQGGSAEALNLRVRCSAHNKLYAEETYGREYVEAKIHERRRKQRNAGRVRANDVARQRHVEDITDRASPGAVDRAGGHSRAVESAGDEPPSRVATNVRRRREVVT